MASLAFKSHDVLIDDLIGQACTIGLLTVNPNGDGTGVVEPNNIYGYARQPMVFTTPVRDQRKTVLANDEPLIFGPVVAQNWPTVTHVGLFDANGDLRAYSALAATRTAPLGDSISFGDRAIQFKFN